MSSATYEKVEDEEETELKEDGKTGEADSAENQDKEATTEQQQQPQQQEPEQQPEQQQDAESTGELCFNIFNISFLPNVLLVIRYNNILPRYIM